MTKTAFIIGKHNNNDHSDKFDNKLSVIGKILFGKGFNTEYPHTLPGNHLDVKQSIRNLTTCDELHLCHDWATDKHCNLLRDIALRIDIKVVYH